MRGRTERDTIAETLHRIGREYLQQTRARNHHRGVGPPDNWDDHDYKEFHRFAQGRWAFKESARLLCQHAGRDFEAWLDEWRDWD